MSTLNVSKIQHESAAGDNINLDPSGNVEVAGSITAAGDVSSGGVFTSDVGVYAYNTGNLYVRNNGSPGVGAIRVYSGLGNSESDITFNVNRNGQVELGDNNQIVLEPNGSIIAANSINGSFIYAGDINNEFSRLNTKNVSVRNDDSNGESIIVYQGGTSNADKQLVLKSDGSINDLFVDSFKDGSGEYIQLGSNVALADDGNTEIINPAERAAAFILDPRGQRFTFAGSQANENLETGVTIGFNGSTTFGPYSANSDSGYGAIINADGTVGTCQVQAIAATSDAASAIIVRRGKVSTWSVNYGGTASFRNAVLNLEPDNPDAWETREESYEEQITGPLGQVERTVTRTREVKEYVGATLSVKDELIALRDRATKQDEVIAQMTRMLADLGADVSTLPASESPAPKKRGGKKR